MNKVFKLIIFAVIAATMASCGPKYIDATYTYQGEVHGKMYNMRLTLTKDGRAHLKMLDRPIIEDLSDIQWLNELHDEGVYGNYLYEKEHKCYRVWTHADRGIDNVWYQISSLNFVSTIYIADDGYVYFTREKFSSDTWDYKTIGGLSDVKSQTNRGPRYTQYVDK